MEEKVSKVQKLKQYILRNKILVAVTACLVICILAMSGTVSSAVDERDLMSNQLQEQTESLAQINEAIASIEGATQDNVEVASATNEITDKVNKIAIHILDDASSKKF